MIDSMKNANNIKRGPIANCIALHDFAMIPENIKGWFDYTVDFFRAHDIEPIHMSNKNNDKIILFKNGIKQLKEKNYKIEAMEIGGIPKNYDGDIFNHFFLSFLPYHGRGIVLCFDDHIAGFISDLIENTAKELSQFFAAQYGYSYQRKFSQGPEWYPIGVIGGNEDISDEESDQITQWGLKCSNKKYTLGDLRDIYPYNFLSTPHLERDIFGQPLRQWIESHSSRGKLTLLTDTLWSWHLTPDQISPVRNALVPTGIILCP